MSSYDVEFGPGMKHTPTSTSHALRFGSGNDFLNGPGRDIITASELFLLTQGSTETTQSSDIDVKLRSSENDVIRMGLLGPPKSQVKLRVTTSKGPGLSSPVSYVDLLYHSKKDKDAGCAHLFFEIDTDGSVDNGSITESQLPSELSNTKSQSLPPDVVTDILVETVAWSGYKKVDYLKNPDPRAVLLPALMSLSRTSHEQHAESPQESDEGVTAFVHKSWQINNNKATHRKLEVSVKTLHKLLGGAKAATALGFTTSANNLGLYFASAIQLLSPNSPYSRSERAVLLTNTREAYRDPKTFADFILNGLGRSARPEVLGSR